MIYSYMQNICISSTPVYEYPDKLNELRVTLVSKTLVVKPKGVSQIFSFTAILHFYESFLVTEIIL